MNPLEVSMNERKFNVAQIIDHAKTNPLVDYNDSIECFYVFAPEVYIYKYSGDNSRLFAKLDEEIISNTNNLKSFLETIAFEDSNIKVIDVIKTTLL